MSTSDITSLVNNAFVLALVAGFFTLASKGKDFKNKANEKFLDEKIAVYERIRNVIKDLKKYSYIKHDIKTCDISKLGLSTSEGVTVHYSPAISNLDSLKEIYKELDDIFEYMFFIEANLQKKLDVLKVIVFRIIKLYENGIRQPELLSYLVYHDICHYCAIIEEEVCKFYTRKRYLKAGKVYQAKEIAKYRKKHIESNFTKIRMPLFFFLGRPEKDWTLQNLTDNKNKILPAIFPKLEKAIKVYQSVCNDCTLNCDFKADSKQKTQKK